MSLPIITLNSYVEIAISVAIQGGDHEGLKQSVSEWCKSDEAQKTMPEWTEIEIKESDLLRLKWRQRIQEWQRMLPDNGQPIEDCSSVKELKFGTLFLQHPIAAMSLWNFMQTIYALDRLVCCTSDESREKVLAWENMQVFEYLEASKVEKRWRSSLQSLKREIEDKNNAVSISPRKGATFSPATKGHDINEGSSYGSKEIQPHNSRTPLLQRINDIDAAISRLEEAQAELKRSFQENLKGVKIVDQMLQRANVAVRMRFSMIDTYLNMEENHKDGIEIDQENIGDEIESNYHPRLGKSNSPLLEELRSFKPLSRTNSMELVKHQLVIAWISTTRGDATLIAIVILSILLVPLRYLQLFLIGDSITYQI